MRPPAPAPSRPGQRDHPPHVRRARRGGTLPARSRRAGWLAAAVAAAAALFGLYWLQARSATVNSDSASIILQGADMLHGNLLLHGWITADVSFYATELVQYMLLQTVLPMSPGLVYVAGAMTYTILVVLAALLAKGRAAGREGIIRAGVGAGVMLAPALGAFTSSLLHAPNHTGSAVPVLLAWLVIDRCPPRWYVPVAVCALLAWGAVSDPLVDITGAAAIAVACGARSSRRLALRRNSRRAAGSPAPATGAPAAPPWFEPSLAVAALASAGAAALGARAIRAAGGFTTSPVNLSLAGVSEVWRHAPVTGKGLLGLFGAAFWTEAPAALPWWQLAFDAAHLAGVILAVIGLGLALRRFFRPDSLLTAGLAAGIVLNIAAFMTSQYATDVLSIREAAAVLPFSAICAGRLIPGAALRRARPGGGRFRSRGPTLALAGVGAAYVAMLAVNAVAARPAVPAYQNVASWLARHHLTSGLAADYWLANIVTVDSGNRVKVRTAAVGNGTVSRPAGWEVNTTWYDPSAGTADFLLTDPGAGKAQLRAAERAFGPPERIERLDGCTVLIWRRDILARLRGPGPGSAGHGR